MKNLMSAFVDSYEDLTLLIEKKVNIKVKTFIYIMEMVNY